MEIKTVILPLDSDGIPDTVEASLVNQHLAMLRDKRFFSSSHTIMMGSKATVIVEPVSGKVYAKQDCMFESLIMAEVPVHLK